MKEEAKAKHEWLKNAMALVNEKPTPFAKKAGISPSTITRFYNDPDKHGPPYTHTLDRIAEHYQIKSFDGKTPVTMHSDGFNEEQSRVLKPNEAAEAQKFIISKQATNENPDRQSLWVMTGRALENRNIINDDWLLVDIQRRPEINDIVCISLRDESTFEARTVFRVLHSVDPITLCLPASNDQSINNKIIIIDGIKAVIYGVVSKVLRNAP